MGHSPLLLGWGAGWNEFGQLFAMVGPQPNTNQRGTGWNGGPACSSPWGHTCTYSWPRHLQYYKAHIVRILILTGIRKAHRSYGPQVIPGYQRAGRLPVVLAVCQCGTLRLMVCPLDTYWVLMVSASPRRLLEIVAAAPKCRGRPMCLMWDGTSSPSLRLRL